MYSKYFVLLLYICTSVKCKKSFSLVLDTTVSMRDEIDIIKANIGSVVGSLKASEYKNFIVVPFNDPDVDDPVISDTPEGFVNSLNTIKTSGGLDCPENSLAGIEKALRVSEPQSSILVFTDAYAKEYASLNSILDLCKNKFSQVMVFLSGVCLATAHTREGDLGVYYDVTRACSGSVFRFDTASNLRQAFRIITEMHKVEWNEVINFESFSTQKELTFRTDSLTTDIMLVISGEQPQVRIAKQDGQYPETEKMIDTQNSQVIRMPSSEGQYVATVTCEGTTSATLYRRSELPYEYGFSTVLPRSILETSPTPMPGRTNYILISVLKNSMQCTSLEIFDGFITKEIKVETTDNPQLYLAKALINPDRLFRISVKGHDSNDKTISCSTYPLTPQKLVENTTWTKPTSFIIEPEDKLINFGANLTIACKVNGYPKPKIQWTDDSEREFLSTDVLLEIPSTYISYATIVNVTANMTVFCKCENAMGEDSQSMDLFVNRTYTFDVIQVPIEQTVEYGSEGKLFCQVEAYPDATIKWYHNDSLVETTDNIQVVPEDFALYIKNMGLEDVGSYTCEAENIVNKKTFTANVHIYGIEAPQIGKGNAEIILKPGDWTNLECGIIKGKPIPEVTWSYKPEYAFDFEALPEGVFEENGKLKIPSIQKEHKGVYKCDAVNFLGQDSGEITIKIRYSPIIKNSEIETMTVREGDLVELPCEVTASPKASVRWEMSQDDVIIPFDNRHITDPSHRHRFNALGKDSGNYHCIAENNIGRAEITVKLNVLVAPYIEPPKSKYITAASGSNVVLACNILFGNPAPSLKWEFLTSDFISTVLKKGKAAHVLDIKNISRTNVGTYRCIADNDIGSDTIKYYVKLQ